MISAAKERTRTLEQNSQLWALLTEFAQQVDHNGRKYQPDEWLSIFLHACGHTTKFLPALDGRGFVAHRASSRVLRVGEMSELIECIRAEGTMRGVKFRDEAGGAA